MNPAAIQSEAAPRILFFDNGFFRALLRDDFVDRMSDPESDLRVALQLPFRSWRTPFSAMEWIGMDSASLPKPSPFDPASVNGDNFIVPAYQHYQQHYDSVAELDRVNLATLAETQRHHVCPRLVDIWDTVVAGIFDMKDVSGWLRFALCFDAVHKLDVHKNRSRDYWNDLKRNGFYGCEYRIRNLSKFRLACRMWLQFRHNAPADQKASTEETHRLLDLRDWNWKDYLDGDLVHAAAYGVEDTDGTRHRVVCLTCDRPEVVINRICLYKWLLSHVRKLYQEAADAEGYPLDFESSHNGEVLCFDFQGNLVRRIDVASETPALAFLGKEPS